MDSETKRGKKDIGRISQIVKGACETNNSYMPTSNKCYYCCSCIDF